MQHNKVLGHCFKLKIANDDEKYISFNKGNNRFKNEKFPYEPDINNQSNNINKKEENPYIELMINIYLFK